MQNTQPIMTLLNAVDTSHMTEAERYAMFTNTQGSKSSFSGLVSTVKFIKKTFANLKTNLNPHTLKHA